MTPVFIPMHTTRTIDCIIQDGKRYCENTDLSQHELGLMLCAATVWIIASGVGLWIDGNRFHEFPWVSLTVVLSPIWLGGILLLVFGS